VAGAVALGVEAVSAQQVAELAFAVGALAALRAAHAWPPQ